LPVAEPIGLEGSLPQVRGAPVELQGDPEGSPEAVDVDGLGADRERCIELRTAQPVAVQEAQETVLQGLRVIPRP
jgi:hypothetical protein